MAWDLKEAWVGGDRVVGGEMRGSSGTRSGFGISHSLGELAWAGGWHYRSISGVEPAWEKREPEGCCTGPGEKLWK